MSNRKIFHKLVPLNKVLEIVEKYRPLSPLGVEEVDLIEAVGRVLAEDLYSPIDYPPFDRSDVDGYAVDSRDLEGVDELRPKSLKVIGSVEAGDKPGYVVNRGKAVEIATGAMIPRGANAVVMVEYTKRVGDSILVYRSVRPGENITMAGSDISYGDLIVRRGTRITSSIVGVLAGLGIRRVKVYRKPRIAVISTGKEIVEPGEPLEWGMVYDVNGYLITSMLRELGADAIFIGRVPDDYESLYSVVEDAIKKYDLVVTSGGTSAGPGDLVYRVFDSLGEPGIIVHGIAVKPGKPTVIAIAYNKILIGLPGFPLSCYMMASLILRPIVCRLLGLDEEPYRGRIRARLAIRIRKPVGRAWLLPVAIVSRKGEYVAYPVSLKSGSLSALIYSDGYAVLEEGRDVYMEGEAIEVRLFKPEPTIPCLVIIGSNDILLYRIISYTRLTSISKVISVGSMGGLYALKRGEADIAPSHLLDEETMEYNIPFIKRLGLEGRVRVVRGYDRRIGIIVARGNPKGIKDIKDLLRNDVVIVNRTKGSGTRTLLDMMLKKLAQEMGMRFDEVTRMIKGYDYEVKTHTAVAAAIASGRADVGIGIEYAARIYGLDFIPLAWEHYDFVVNKDSIDKHCVRRFIEALKEERVIDLINSTPGYRAPGNIGEIIY